MPEIGYTLTPELFRLAEKAKESETLEDFMMDLAKEGTLSDQAAEITNLRGLVQSNGFPSIEVFYAVVKRSEIEDPEVTRMNNRKLEEKHGFTQEHYLGITITVIIIALAVIGSVVYFR